MATYKSVLELEKNHLTEFSCKLTHLGIRINRATREVTFRASQGEPKGFGYKKLRLPKTVLITERSFPLTQPHLQL